MNVTIPRGFKIGHAENAFTGVTVILCEKGAAGGVDCRGGGPGTRETDLLRPDKTVGKINAVVLTGGSAFGLASADGVMEYLRQKGVGFKVGSKRVPIVTGAVIYDLNDREYNYPSAQMGFDACVNAGSATCFGQTGVGKGATVGKIRGLRFSCKSGVGAATVKVAGITVTAVVAVNALGDVTDPETGAIIAGAKAKDGSFIDANKCLLNGSFAKLLLGTNTTIGCVLTDAKLSKIQANKLASVAHNGLARTIRPVHTDYDGDTMFCLASGHRPALNFLLLQAAAEAATERAIVNAVKSGEGYTVIYDDSDPDDAWECE